MRTPTAERLPSAPAPQESFGASQPEVPAQNAERMQETMNDLARTALQQVSSRPQPEPVVAQQQAPQPIPLEKTELQRDVERVLEEGLKDLYLQLPVEERKIFKIEGEKASTTIATLLQASRVKISEIVKLIRQWLFRLPGVNRFFIEKQAKLKAERIIALRELGKVGAAL